MALEAVDEADQPQGSRQGDVVAELFQGLDRAPGLLDDLGVLDLSVSDELEERELELRVELDAPVAARRRLVQQRLRAREVSGLDERVGELRNQLQAPGIPRREEDDGAGEQVVGGAHVPARSGAQARAAQALTGALGDALAAAPGADRGPMAD